MEVFPCEERELCITLHPFVSHPTPSHPIPLPSSLHQIIQQRGALVQATSCNHAFMSMAFEEKHTRNVPRREESLFRTSLQPSRPVRTRDVARLPQVAHGFCRSWSLVDEVESDQKSGAGLQAVLADASSFTVPFLAVTCGLPCSRP
jgi:hypothetical protein